MNKRQEAFAEHYVQCGSIVQSAIAAGYSETYAKGRGYEMLENVGVSAYIKQLSEQVRTSRILNAEKRQALLSDIATDQSQSTADRIRAIDVLNRMTGEYITRVQADIQTSDKLADVLDQLGGQGLTE